MKIYEFTAKKRDGELESLSKFENKVILIVNTATGCGFTPQYEGLENLYKKYHEKGLEIMDFPCDQFGHQAPGSDDEIHQFCVAKYQTSFDQYSKIDVNGENEHPLYAYLKETQPIDIINGEKNKGLIEDIKKFSESYKKDNDIIWNFTKFLVDRKGNVVKRYDPTYLPSDMEEDIEGLL